MYGTKPNVQILHCHIAAMLFNNACVEDESGVGGPATFVKSLLAFTASSFRVVSFLESGSIVVVDHTCLGTSSQRHCE